MIIQRIFEINNVLILRYESGDIGINCNLCHVALSFTSHRDNHHLRHYRGVCKHHSLNDVEEITKKMIFCNKLIT